MVQPDGFCDVPPGKVAAVVTHLDMTERPRLRAAPELPTLSLRKEARMAPAAYRALFRAVGGQSWLWCSRLMMSDAALSEILWDVRVDLCILEQAGAPVGLLELDFREPDACELAFLGLVPTLVGQGAGRYLINIGITRAWSRPISRLHVHTCTFDHPDALAFYIRSGFTPRRRQIEVMDDPRLTGVLDRDAAPHIPVIPDI